VIIDDFTRSLRNILKKYEWTLQIASPLSFEEIDPNARKHIPV
jgi:hypothetical protein